MRKFEFLLYDPKRFFGAALLMFFVLPLAIGGIIGSRAGATHNSQPPQPYTGGAPVAKVFYPADGSTITVTATGAVIKQSPGGNPYRQGWVNPSDIGGYNSFGDLGGHIRSGATNPYKVPAYSSAPVIYEAAENEPDRDMKKRANTNHQTVYTSDYQPAEKTAAVYRERSVKVRKTAYEYAGAAKTLPDTGPGGVMGVGGAATVLATLGHYLYHRRRR